MEDQHVQVAPLRLAIQSSVNVFRSNFFTIVLIVILINLPINLILQAIPINTEEGLSAWSTYYRAKNFLEILIGTLSSLCVVHIAYAAHQESKLSIREAFRRSLDNYMSAVGAKFLFNFIIGIALLLFLIPSIVIGVYWMFMFPQIVINGNTGMKSLSSSYNFVKGRWWKFAGRGAILLVLYIVILLFLGIIDGLLANIVFIEVITTTLFNVVTAFGLIVITELFLQSGGETSQEKTVEQLSEIHPLGQDEF